MWFKHALFVYGNVPAVHPKFLAEPGKGSFGSYAAPLPQQAARPLPLVNPAQSGAGGS